MTDKLNDDSMTKSGAQEVSTDSTEEIQDEVANFSNVTPIKKAHPPLLWLGGAGIVLTVLLLLVLTRSPASKNKIPVNNNTQDIEATLKANMEALHSKEKATLGLPRENDSDIEQQPEPEKRLSQDDMLILEQAHQQELERQRILQARFNAPTSLIASGGNVNNQTPSEGNTGSTTTAVLAGHNANSDFANQNTGIDTAVATHLSHPEATIAQGEFVQAVLETPINSDLPGMVRAVTSQPIYGYTGSTPLMPAGARLIGQYSSGVVQGQSRVMVVWNRVLLPDGTSAQLNSPGTDDQGMSGQGADAINRHFWSQFGQATLLSILGAGAATAGVNSGDQYNSAAYYRTAMSQSFSDTASTVLEQNINTKPTLIIHQGAQINVFVARDVDFYNVLHAD